MVYFITAAVMFLALLAQHFFIKYTLDVSPRTEAGVLGFYSGDLFHFVVSFCARPQELRWKSAELSRARQKSTLLSPAALQYERNRNVVNVDL